MDHEQRARRQSLRLIISEAVMVIAVVVTVVVLAFLVSGYWLSSDFTVERQGMLQISSVPTGANVAVDGEAPWYQRTNTSKVLSAAEHTVSLTKDDYDTWSRTINIREGLLYRIHYPRLFLLERTPETFYTPAEMTFATETPDRATLLVANNTTAWQLLNLTGDKPEVKTLDLSSLFTAAPTIVSADWASDNEHVLLNTDAGWMLVNIKNPTTSLILSTLDPDLSNFKIFNNSASVLLAMKGSDLYKVDVSAREVTLLQKNILNYDFYDHEVAFVGADYRVGTFRLNSPENVSYSENVYDHAVRVYLSQFYDNKYLTVVDGAKIVTTRRDDDAVFFAGEFSFEPSVIRIGHGGEYITAYTGAHIATVDFEALNIRDWTIDAAEFGWLDDDMLYAIVEGRLVVYDFDGLNRRELVSGGVSATGDVWITNNKYLYYFNNGAVTREIIAK